MVVRHDDGQSPLFPIGNLLRGRDSIVTSDNRVNPVLQRPVDQHLVQAVPVLDTVRNVGIHLRSQPHQAFLQNIGGINPVNVIIPDDADGRAFPHFPRQNLYRLVHVPHPHPIMQVGKRAI